MNASTDTAQLSTAEKLELVGVTPAQLIEDVNALARVVWADYLDIFAEECFTTHLTIKSPAYHSDIFRSLMQVVNASRPTPMPPLEPQEKYIGPSPTSLAISNLPMGETYNSNNNSKSFQEGKTGKKSSKKKVESGKISAPEILKVSEVLEVFRNSVVVEPREFGKSTKAMIYVMWALINRYKKFVLYISKSFDHAVKLVGPIKHEFETNELIKETYGDLRGTKWTESEMEFSTGAKLLAVGRGQTVRGLKFLNFRPDLVILDDIEDDESVNNSELRLKLHEWLDKQVIPGVDSRLGTVSAFGTILHPDSLLANLSAPKDRSEKYKSFLSLFYGALDANEKSIWEEKFTTEKLLEERRRDFYTFAQERMNQPIPIGSGMFKREYFKYFTVEDGMILSEGREIPIASCNLYLTCDIAMTVKEYSDYTVLLVSAVTPDNEIFVLDYTRERWEDPDRIMDEIFRLNKKYPTIKMNGIETVAAQKWLMVNMNKEMRKRNIFLPLKALVADKDKLRRISQLQPRFASGAVYIKAHMSELESELMLFPKSSHDDVSDALAYVMQIMIVPEKEEAVINRRAKREDYKFSISGEDVLSRIQNKGKATGIFKEYQPTEDHDPFKESDGDTDYIQYWDEAG